MRQHFSVLALCEVRAGLPNKPSNGKTPCPPMFAGHILAALSCGSVPPLFLDQEKGKNQLVLKMIAYGFYLDYFLVEM
jgi:hypothetical protein